jgi:lipopolysaccharide export system protein LptA
MSSSSASPCVGLVRSSLVLAVALLSGLPAAEITANRMAILNTEQGKVTQFEDGVVIADGGTRITAGRVEFYDQENLAVIHGGSVAITTPTSNVLAESARYLIGARRTYLYRNVVIRQPEREVRSQALMLDNATDDVVADGGLQIDDAKQGIQVAGGRGSFNLKTEDGVIAGSPQLKLARASGMTVTSEVMELTRSRQHARAIGSVRALTGDATLTAETLDYFMEQDSARAFGSPKMVQKENTITGDLMSFRFRQNDLERIDVRGTGANSPRLVQTSRVRPARPGAESVEVSRMQGRRIALAFAAGHLSEIRVEGDSLLQPELHQKSNRTQGDSIAFRFRDGVVEQVRVMGRTTGTFLTDDGDRIEVSGSESLISFKDGEASQVEIAEVRLGRLFRENPAAQTRESRAPARGVK